jgi:Tol biopolymer transport system component
MLQSRSALSSALLLSFVLFVCGRTDAQTSSGKLVFSDEASRLLIINADGTGQTILTAGGNIRDSNPTYSPDGTKIAFDRNIQGKTNIFIMNPDGTNPVAVTSNGPLPNTNFNLDPSWSPDGTKLVFISDRGGQRKSEIWVVNVDGSGLVRLTTNVQLSSDGQGPVYGWDTNPSWSPDGSRIAFVSTQAGFPDTELYVMNADGSNQTRLTDNPNDERTPTWSPDSQKIGFYSNGGSTFGINIMLEDGTNVVNVTHDGFAPAWSPDGGRFAFQDSDPNNGFKAAVFTMSVDGTNRVKITNNSISSLVPDWAPISSPPIPTLTISGQVLDGNGTPINGATLNLTGVFGRSTQSNAAGAYSFAGLPAGNYRIDIARSGYGFVPASVDLPNLTADQTVNFSAFVAFSISGQVSGLGGNSIFVNLSGSQTRSALTDFNGHYSFDILPAGGNYTVGFTNSIWNISPNSVTFNNLSANQTANFNAVRATYTISGRITRLGNPKPGITVALADTSGNTPPTTTTDANGQYSFTGVRAGGTYFVRPAAANYLMQPQTHDFTSLDGNKTADFVALSANHLGLGNASPNVGEGGCSLQVTVFRGGNAGGVGPITVDYATVDGTATAGSDYTAVSGTLNFPEGTFSRTITIPIFDDQLIEGSEQFSISLSNPTGEVDLGTPSSATVTITDNDPTTPKLYTETGSDRAIAFNATSMVAAPFHLTTPLNFSDDTRTRISFFVENLQINSCQGPPVIAVEAEDALLNHFQLPLEAVISYTGNAPFRQVIVLLPENLSAGDLLITISTNGLVSNKARITIQP